MTNTDLSSWGTYAPPTTSLFLRILIAIGLSRGAVRKKIIKVWIDTFGPIVDVQVRGICYRLNLSDNVTDCKIFASSVIYDKQELAYLRRSCRNGVFVDVGANIGYYSLVMAQNAHCRVLAIEPNPAAVDRLRFNVDLNSDLKKRITIVPMGVGDEGSFNLHLGDNLGCSSLHAGLNRGANKIVTIQTKPLLTIVNEHQIDRIDALKIDIEGMEDRALVPFFDNAQSRLWPGCIVLEDDHQEIWKTDLLQTMKDKGYEIVARTSGNAILIRKA